MNNLISIRPRLTRIKPTCILMQAHHAWCLENYVGLAHNKAHANSWERISKTIKENPDIKVKIVDEPDALCISCPSNGDSNGIKCNKNFVTKLNERFKTILGLEAGQQYEYKEIVEKLRALMNPQKRKEICGECGFFQYGVCKDTFNKK